jgi:hypothetical protein
MLGKAKRVRVEKENTTIIDGAGKKKDIEGREETTSDAGFVRFLIDRLLPERQPGGGGEGRHEMERALADAAVMAAARGLVAWVREVWPDRPDLIAQLIVLRLDSPHRALQEGPLSDPKPTSNVVRNWPALHPVRGRA